MSRLIERVLRTDDAIAPLVLRLGLGTVIFAHGAQKALGWFGGHGFAGTMGFLTDGMGLPGIVAALVILIEFAGAAALIAGAGGRLMALGIGAVMLGATLTAHLGNGFFMNWSGAQAGEGFEFHVLAMAMAASLVVTGSGAWSVDRWLVRVLGRQPARQGRLIEDAA